MKQPIKVLVQEDLEEVKGAGSAVGLHQLI